MKLDAKKIIIIVVLVAILGFVIGLIVSSVNSDWACTEMACRPASSNGEQPCNSCFQEKPIFILGIVNVMEKCTSKEIVTYKDGMMTDSRVDSENKSCDYELYILTFNLRYLFSNPEQPVNS